MNAKSDNTKHAYSGELSEFAKRLEEQITDEGLLDNIHSAFQRLLSDEGQTESDIRRILLEQRRTGNLREETFELVERMLDRIVTEDLATAPPEEDVAAQSDDPFGDTTVIEDLKPGEESADDRLQVGSVLRDRFLLQERIAGGSMGVVYKALDRRLAEADSADSYVAIKVLSPRLSRNGNALRALKQEAAKGRFLSHPNIVRFIDLDREDELYFMVMEWLDGTSLASVLDDNSSRPIDKEMALEIVRKVSTALDYAHLRGVVHADVKPGNIMILPDGEVKLLDFGVARIRQRQTDGEAGFDPGVLGAVTPAYSSMQVLTGEEPVAEDDVFSLGCLMYRLVAGYRVFGPRNAAEAAEAGMEPQRPQGLTDSEWRALRKALSFSRVSRFASPKEFTEALDSTVFLKTTQSLHDLDEGDDEGRRLWPYVAMLAALSAAVFGLYQYGMLPQSLGLGGMDAPSAADRDTTAIQPPRAESRQQQEPPVDTQDPVPDDELNIDEVFAEDLEARALEEQPALVDFSALPPATVEVRLAFPGAERTEVDLILREDEPPAIIDFVRGTNIAETLTVRVEEVGFSGNRSPWESGQYQISDDSVAHFPAGQDRARVTVSMTPDPLREPDRQVSLLIRDFENAESEFAFINLSLQDDDQRRFESSLGPNTVAFAVGQVSVRERDPAVQIDMVRFNPDRTTLTVEYVLREVTATEGEDYFAPGTRTIQFGPGQRSARILIPLVQDSAVESDEAFALELPATQAESTDANIFRRIAVMIRDDDSTIE